MATDADAAAVGRVDGGIDADDLAGEVEERPSGIATVDRGIDLKIIVVRAGLNVAATGRNDARRDGPAQSEGIADGNDPVADLSLVGIAEGDVRHRLDQLGLQQRQVCLRIATDDIGIVAAAIVQNDLDLVGIADDVVIGDDMAFGIDEKARTH